MKYSVHGFGYRGMATCSYGISLIIGKPGRDEAMVTSLKVIVVQLEVWVSLFSDVYIAFRLLNLE